MSPDFTPKLFSLWKAGIPREQLRKDLVSGIIATFMAGVLLVAMGLLRAGRLLKYFPHTLIVGFLLHTSFRTADGRRGRLISFDRPCALTCRSAHYCTQE